MKPRDIQLHPCVKALEGTIQGQQSGKEKQPLLSQKASHVKPGQGGDVTAKAHQYSISYALRRIVLHPMQTGIDFVTKTRGLRAAATVLCKGRTKPETTKGR